MVDVGGAGVGVEVLVCAALAPAPRLPELVPVAVGEGDALPVGVAVGPPVWVVVLLSGALMSAIIATPTTHATATHPRNNTPRLVAFQSFTARLSVVRSPRRYLTRATASMSPHRQQQPARHEQEDEREWHVGIVGRPRDH